MEWIGDLSADHKVAPEISDLLENSVIGQQGSQAQEGENILPVTSETNGSSSNQTSAASLTLFQGSEFEPLLKDSDALAWRRHVDERLKKSMRHTSSDAESETARRRRRLAGSNHNSTSQSAITQSLATVIVHFPEGLQADYSSTPMAPHAVRNTDQEEDAGRAAVQDWADHLESLCQEHSGPDALLDEPCSSMTHLSPFRIEVKLSKASLPVRSGPKCFYASLRLFKKHLS